ncbi:hypothetical protein R5R35_001215 [Gryllus longicercus]|uniref:Uncharacterized protein n=1 Tax=Gryllus longicercus TaxID=2509291 RepID=A0AAN9VPF9_9ORTH
MSSRRRSGASGTQDGADVVGDALLQVAQSLANLQEALRQQKQDADRRSQEALRLQEERLREMDRKLQEKDDAVRSLQQRLQETHVRMTAIGERTTAPDGSGEEGLQRLEGRVNEGEASLQSAFMPRVEALLRQQEEPQSTRATVATASASTRREPAYVGARGGGEETPFFSPATPSGAGYQGAAADVEVSERQRVELRVRQAKLRWERAQATFYPLGEQLCKAAEEGRLSDVRRLIHSGAYVNYTDRYGSTPLVYAVFNDHADVVSLLLQRGADVNAVNLAGNSALHWAAMRDPSGRCVELLVRAGADVNARDLYGATPLHWAAQCNNEEAVRALLAAGARRDLKCWDRLWKNRTPFETSMSPIIQDLLRL